MNYKISIILTISILLVSIMAYADDGIKMSKARIFLGGIDVRVDSKWIDKNKSKGSLLHGDYARKIVVDGRARYYKIHVPPAYKANKPSPVVMLFHGGGGYPDAIRFQSGMDSVANQENFIVVYPAGYNKRILKDRLLVWNDGRLYKDGTASKINDVAFVKALLKDLEQLFNIDKKRIYAAGFSNGAQLSYRLAKKLPDLIAAIAVVAGQRAAQEGNESCPARPVPVMQFSGKQDPVAPFRGGKPSIKPAFITKLDGVENTIMTWVKCNACDPGKVTIDNTSASVKKTWYACANDAKVTLWILEDGGHAWPGGKTFPAERRLGVGPTSKAVNASRAMWKFFKGFSL